MATHSKRSQKRLHDLFPGFAKLVGSHIKTACERVIRDTRRQAGAPLRILDLGCGSVPYSDALNDVAADFACGDAKCLVELVLVDKDDSIETEPICRCAAEWKFLNALSIGRAAIEQSACPQLTGTFDLVILAASLHEFYFDAVSAKDELWVPARFHEDFLRAVCRDSGLVEKRYGRVILADYAWAGMADPKHLERIAEEQLRVVEHADPPWAFVHVRRILQSMFQADFSLESSDRRGLYDQLDNHVVRDMFPGLTEDERETLRLRTGYVMTFQHDGTPSPEPPGPSGIEKAILRVSRSVEQMFDEDSELHPDSIRDNLNGILTQPVESQGNLSPLSNLTKKIYQDSQDALRQFRAPGPGPCEIWFGIGLRKFANSRFIPTLRSSWNGRTVQGGVFIRDGGALDVGDRPQAGPVAIAYEHCLSPTSQYFSEFKAFTVPTIHSWCVHLHKAIRNGKSDEVTQRASGIFRSLTILSPDASAHDHAISAGWGTPDDQKRTGHYLLRLCPETVIPEPAQRLYAELDKISEIVTGRRMPWLPQEDGAFTCAVWAYSAFLSVVFGLGTSEELENLRKTLEDIQSSAQAPLGYRIGHGRDSLLQELEVYAQNSAKALGFPRYTAYTTVALGCDGLSSADPNTVMSFSGHPIPPEALGRIERYTSDLCEPMVEAESKLLIERQAQTQSDLEATRRLIRAFGHDGKTPAELIGAVLNDTSFSPADRISISSSMARKLTERLGGYRWLLSDEKASRRSWERLWRQVQDFAHAEWQPLEEIWNDAVAMALLSVCVKDTDHWSEFRDRFGISGPEQRVAIARAVSGEGALTQMKKIVNSSNFTESNSTLGLRTPTVLERETGGETTSGSPAVYHALRLVLSEIITNAFRHELPFADTTKPIALVLSCEIDPSFTKPGERATQELATLTVRISPSWRRANSYISGRYNGLLSMKDTCSAIGASMNTQPLTLLAADESGVDLPLELPFCERTEDDILWTIKEVPMFR